MVKFKKRFFNNLKDNKYIWLTFIVAIFLFLMIYSVKSIIPIGKNTMLTIDFYHQYGPLLSELYDKIKSSDNLIYSFNTGLGLPFFRNFFNYLSSPFNIIILLFSRDNIVVAFSIIIALKIIAASCIMSYFLKKFFNKNSIFITLFGLTYGFSSYFVSFYWNIMWLDGLIFLPLVVLGIKKLIDENKINLYILSLFLSIISNYFISYMICIFSCLFFLIYIIFKENITRKELIKKILLFMVSSLIAGGIASFMLFPYISSLSSISATGDSFTFYKTFNFNLIHFFANHFSLVKSIVFSSQEYFLPNISSGIIILILLISFYFNSNIKLKYKIMATIFICCLIISFIYVPLDFIWHGFHTPNDLPFRYSFIYVFIINSIAFYSLEKIDGLRIRYSIIITTALLIFLFYLAHIQFLSEFAFNVNVIFLLSVLAIFVIFKLKNNDIGKFVLLFLVCADIILNINENWNINHDKTEFMNNYTTVNSVIENIKNSDNSFYRIEKNFNQTLNDGAWYNYNGISIFSSVAYEQMAKSQKKLGISGNDVNSYYYRQNTPIYNSIMSIKYFVGLENKNPLYKLVKNINSYDIYENTRYLPPIFGVSQNIKEWSNDDYNPFINQQNFVDKSTEIENVFEKLPIDYDMEQQDYKFTNDNIINLNQEQTTSALLNIRTKKNSNVYLYVYSYNLENFIANNRLYSVTTNEPYIIDIGYFEENEDIELKLYLNPEIYSVSVLAYQMDIDKFDKFYEISNNSSLQITDFSNDYIKGIIETDSDKTVFTSLNFDEGFTVYVDDKKVDTFKIANSFLAFDIKKGKHDIKIIYKIPHLKIGIIISSISLIILIIINLWKYKNKKKIDSKL